MMIAHSGCAPLSMPSVLSPIRYPPDVIALPDRPRKRKGCAGVIEGFAQYSIASPMSACERVLYCLDFDNNAS